MSRLVGHWSWAFLARRCAFSVFRAVYRFIEVAGRRKFDIWPSVVRELDIAIGLAPLLFSSIASPWFPKVLASDASGDGQGVVAADSTPAALARMSLCRPPVPCGLASGAQESDPCSGVCPHGEKIDRSLHPDLQSARWRTIVSSRWQRPEHINVLELRALNTAVRWAISHPSAAGARVLLWCDSLVGVGGVRKGRSSSLFLMPRLRTLTALLLASGTSLYCNWIPTEVNPADGPSRWFKFDSRLGFPGEGPPRERDNFLTVNAHGPATGQKYVNAVLRFLEWADENGEEPETVAELDEALTQWFHEIYRSRDGGGRSIAASAISGLHMLVPIFKGQLAKSALALRGWARMMPSQQYPPLAWDLAVVIGVHLAVNGRWALGVGTLLAFDCYLRVGELCGLRRKDVADCGDPRMGAVYTGMALRLKHTKTGKNQWVEVRSPVVRTLLRSLLVRTARDPYARLFPVSTAKYRKHFKAACAFLQLSGRYVPHSLRHGGATHDHLRGVRLEDILHHGRWASTKSARHYIQAGPALLLRTSVPPHVTELAKILVPDVALAFSSLSQSHGVGLGR
jgi:integrase